MNLIGRYDDHSVSLEGATDALHQLSHAIRSTERTQQLLLVVPTTLPAPYSGYIKSLKIECSVGKVSISRVDDQASITGSPEMLAILARNIDRLAEQPRERNSDGYKDHIHVEYHPDHFYLNEGSVPLVIARDTHKP